MEREQDCTYGCKSHEARQTPVTAVRDSSSVSAIPPGELLRVRRGTRTVLSQTVSPRFQF